MKLVIDLDEYNVEGVFLKKLQDFVNKQSEFDEDDLGFTYAVVDGQLTLKLGE